MTQTERIALADSLDWYVKHCTIYVCPEDAEHSDWRGNFTKAASALRQSPSELSTHPAPLRSRSPAPVDRQSDVVIDEDGTVRTAAELKALLDDRDTFLVETDAFSKYAEWTRHRVLRSRPSEGEVIGQCAKIASDRADQEQAAGIRARAAGRDLVATCRQAGEEVALDIAKAIRALRALTP